MSSSATLILSEVQGLRAEIVSLKAQVTGLQSLLAAKPVSAAPAKAVRAKKEKDPNAPPKERSAWGLFTDRVRGLLRENDYAGKALGPECVQFCSSLKEENGVFASWTDEDILARRAAWSAPEVSKGELKGGKGWAKTGERRQAAKSASVAGSVAGSVAEDDLEDGAASAAPSEEPAKKRGPAKGTKLTEEQKAKRKATREANKAKKEGAAAETSAPASPKVEAAEATAPASPKAAPVAVKAAEPVAAAESKDKFTPVMLKGADGKPKRYFVNLATGHAYNRNEDGSQGSWAGLFSKTPKPQIDFTVPEPGAEEEEELNFGEEM